jgi:hypothetical protein
MEYFEIERPKALIFDAKSKPNLKIWFANGLCYHERNSDDKTVVNFPIVGKYKSNFKPCGEVDIHKFYDPNFKSEIVPLIKTTLNTPIAHIDIDKNCIYTGRYFDKLNYQMQIAILEHEKAHKIALNDEQQADDIAASNFLKLGLNQTQMLYSLKMFAPKCIERYENYFKTLKKQI